MLGWFTEMYGHIVLLIGTGNEY